MIFKILSRPNDTTWAHVCPRAASWGDLSSGDRAGGYPAPKGSRPGCRQDEGPERPFPSTGKDGEPRQGRGSRPRAPGPEKVRRPKGRERHGAGGNLPESEAAEATSRARRAGGQRPRCSRGQQDGKTCGPPEAPASPQPDPGRSPAHRWKLSTIFRWTRRSFLVRWSSMRASTRHSMK